MAREQQQTIYQELFKVNLYKPTLGKYTRRVTAFAIAAVFILGAYSFQQTAIYKLNASIVYPVAITLAVLGCWFAFRITHYPPFADFLISVEGEMGKVTWPDKNHLVRGTIVVLCTMIILTVAMFAYDMIWQFIFRKIGFLTF